MRGESMKFAKRVESESSSVSTRCDFSKKRRKTNKTIHSRDIEERKIDLSGESNSISYLLSFISLSLSLSFSFRSDLTNRVSRHVSDLSWSQSNLFGRKLICNRVFLSFFFLNDLHNNKTRFKSQFNQRETSIRVSVKYFFVEKSMENIVSRRSIESSILSLLFFDRVF